jgi:hypothetical protein
MRRNQKRGPLYTPGFNMRDIEFFVVERPAKKKLSEPPAKKKLSREAERLTAQEKKDRNRRRKIQRFRAQRRRKQQEKKIAKRLKELATIIAQDLLEIRAMNFEENEIKFREQQQREAKAYAEKFTAAFREAVRKEAAEKTAA